MAESLKDLLPVERIRLDLEVHGKRALLEYLAQTAGKSLGFEPWTLILDQIIERERLGPTGLSDACAIPHAHLSGLKGLSLTAARLDKGVDFGAQDRKPSRLVFLLLGPPDSPLANLKTLSKLARILGQEEIRTKLMNATSEDEFLRVLVESEV